MIKSGNTLEWVIDRIIKGEKMKPPPKKEDYSSIGPGSYEPRTDSPTRQPPISPKVKISNVAYRVKINLQNRSGADNASSSRLSQGGSSHKSSSPRRNISFRNVI